MRQHLRRERLRKCCRYLAGNKYDVHSNKCYRYTKEESKISATRRNTLYILGTHKKIFEHYEVLSSCARVLLFT